MLLAEKEIGQEKAGHSHPCVCTWTYRGLDTGAHAGPLAARLCQRQLLPWELIRLPLQLPRCYPLAWSPLIWLCLELPFGREDLYFRFPLHVPAPC